MFNWIKFVIEKDISFTGILIQEKATKFREFLKL
jgi:hypothetical protein